MTDMKRLRLEIKYSNRKEKIGKWKGQTIASGVSALDSIQKELATWEMYLKSRVSRLRKTNCKYGKIVDKIGKLDNIDELCKLSQDEIIAYVKVSIADRDTREAVENVQYWRKQIPLAEDKLLSKYFGKIWNRKARKLLGEDEATIRKELLQKLKEAGCTEIN